MEYVRMGRSGLKVSQVALGCGFRGMTDRDAMEGVINHAIEEGINFIDCANIYGPRSDDHRAGVVEEVLGDVLARGRDDLVVTTKVTSRNGPGPNDVGSSRHHIMREIDQSLRRLQTDHVDIYLIHWRDHTTQMDETVEAMTDVVRSGKARYWGVCNYKAREACRALWLDANAVAPGFITTAMTDKLTDDQKAGIMGQIPAGRMGEASEIASAVVYLASAEAAYVTGTTLHAVSYTHLTLPTNREV